ncbi:MAG: hypothetical protein OEM91_16935, partial [Hyphomicrobiales bacterium]|nr:hypothetical protein [Hyphomicrobiales bacterium]
MQRNANEREIVRSDQSGTVVDRPRRSVFVRLVRGFFQLLLPLALLAGAYATYSYLKATKPEAAKRPPRETVYSVELHPVVFKDHQPELTLYGTTVAGRQVELRSLVAGRV